MKQAILRAGSLVCVMATWLGCGKPAEPATYTYHLNCDIQDLPIGPEGVPMVLNGKEIGKYRSSLDAEIPRETWLSDPATKLALRFATTCGVTDIPLTPTLGRDDEVSARANHTSLKLTANGKVEEMVLYVDNTDGKNEAKLRVGKFEQAIPAGRPWRGPIPFGDCPEGKEITVDGQKIGEAFPPKKKHATFVDVTGGHCYQHEQVWYAGTDPAQRSAAAANHAPPLQFSKQRVFEVPQAMYVLEEPPAKVKSADMFEMYEHLHRIPCGK